MDSLSRRLKINGQKNSSTKNLLLAEAILDDYWNICTVDILNNLKEINDSSSSSSGVFCLWIKSTPLRLPGNLK